MVRRRDDEDEQVDPVAPVDREAAATARGRVLGRSRADLTEQERQLLDALQRERAGYVSRSDTDHVTQVDQQIALLLQRGGCGGAADAD